MPSNPTPNPEVNGSFLGQLFSNRRNVVIAVVSIIVVAGLVIALALAASAGRMDASKNHTDTASGTSAGPKPQASTPGADGSATPGAATPGAAPSEGTGGTPAPAAPVSRPGPTPITATAEIVSNLTATITNIESVAGVGSTPGEVSGPAIRFVVSIKNATASTANLANTIVTVYYGKDRTPGIQLEKPGGAALPATVAPGQSAEGTFVFTVPSNQRADVRIEIDYAVGVAPLVFEGAVAK